DYVPVNDNGKRMVMGAGGWAMKYIPVFADILTDLVLGTTANKSYARYLDQFIFNRPAVSYQMYQLPQFSPLAQHQPLSLRIPAKSCSEIL
ncbi:unnamed protein product, partial [Rotaria magnacalcarata]